MVYKKRIQYKYIKVVNTFLARLEIEGYSISFVREYCIVTFAWFVCSGYFFSYWPYLAAFPHCLVGSEIGSISSLSNKISTKSLKNKEINRIVQITMCNLVQC